MRDQYHDQIIIEQSRVPGSSPDEPFAEGVTVEFVVKIGSSVESACMALTPRGARKFARKLVEAAQAAERSSRG